MYECERVDPPCPQPMATFYNGKSNPFGYPKINENKFQLIWDVTCMVMACHKYRNNLD